MKGLIIILGVVFLLLQFFALSKFKSSFIKYLPLGIAVSGLIFCLILYLNVFWTNYKDVIFENKYFALVLLGPFLGAFIGGVLGIIIYKILISKHEMVKNV